MNVINYATGFILSLVLTIGAYMLAVQHTFSYLPLLIILLALACAQFAVQIVFFLHLGADTASRDRLIVLAGTSFVVLILVSGSVWIMLSLNQRMMPDAQQMEQYMASQPGM